MLPVAVPFVSGSALKKEVKYGLSGAEWSYNALRYGSKVADGLSGARGGALRQALAKEGIDLTGKEAHHIIPTQILKSNTVAQDAVNAGFDFNGAVNGIGLTKVAEGGVHANHPNYSEQIGEALNKFATDNKGYSPEDAKNFLEGLVGKLKNQIQKESVDVGKKVNDLVVPK